MVNMLERKNDTQDNRVYSVSSERNSYHKLRHDVNIEIWRKGNHYDNEKPQDNR